MDPISAVTSAQATASQSVQSAGQVAQASAPVSAPDAPRGTSIEAAEINRAAETSGGNPVTNAADRVMGNLHSTVERLGREIDIVETADPTPAEEAKAALTPQSADIAPGGPVVAGEAPVNPADSNLAMLNKSFDHAMFMAMVNQVISGVGDSSRTLIRQA